MAFLEQRLDSRIARGAEKTVGGGRIKTYTQSLQMTQRFHRLMLWHRFDISHGIRSAADFQLVLDMFYIVFSAPYEGFRFKDWSDYKATQQNTTLTFITGSTWQLCRAHRFANTIHARPIKKPINNGALVVYRTRSGSTSVASATIDYTTGVATISGHASGDTYTWEGEFDLPVTFADNDWTAGYEGSTTGLFMVSQPIKLEELL